MYHAIFDTDLYDLCWLSTLVVTGRIFSPIERFSPAYRFNDEEKLMLETVFTYDPYPNREKLQNLADKLAVSKNKVYNWFHQKRVSSKKKETSAKFVQSEYIAFRIHVRTFSPININNDVHVFMLCLHIMWFRKLFKLNNLLDSPHTAKLRHAKCFQTCIARGIWTEVNLSLTTKISSRWTL